MLSWLIPSCFGILRVISVISQSFLNHTVLVEFDTQHCRLHVSLKIKLNKNVNGIKGVIFVISQPYRAVIRYCWIWYAALYKLHESLKRNKLLSFVMAYSHLRLGIILAAFWKLIAFYNIARKGSAISLDMCWWLLYNSARIISRSRLYLGFTSNSYTVIYKNLIHVMSHQFLPVNLAIYKKKRLLYGILWNWCDKFCYIVVFQW